MKKPVNDPERWREGRGNRLTDLRDDGLSLFFTSEIPQWVLEKPSVTGVLESKYDIITGQLEAPELRPPTEYLGPESQLLNDQTIIAMTSFMVIKMYLLTFLK